VPMRLSMAPPLPMTIPFWESRSRCMVASMETRFSSALGLKA
jgi:hypothetical protein